MNLHEFQSKKILKRYGIPIPAFGVASNKEEVKNIIDTLNLDSAVVKVQVHAGGRGKLEGEICSFSRGNTRSFLKAHWNENCE